MVSKMQLFAMIGVSVREGLVEYLCIVKQKKRRGGKKKKKNTVYQQ